MAYAATNLSFIYFHESDYVNAVKYAYLPLLLTSSPHYYSPLLLTTTTHYYYSLLLTTTHYYALLLTTTTHYYAQLRTTAHYSRLLLTAYRLLPTTQYYPLSRYADLAMRHNRYNAKALVNNLTLPLPQP